MLSETQLRERGIGTVFYDLKVAGWAVKRRQYKNSDIYEEYLAWKYYLKFQCKGPGGEYNSRLTHEKSQEKIDSYLIAKSKGGYLAPLRMPPMKKKQAPVQKTKAVKEKKVKPVDPLMDLDELPEETTTVDMVETITYVFNNMNVDNIDPKDAPSRGAYFYLMRIRKDVTAKNKFYEQGLMKLVPTSAQLKTENKLHDDGRPIIDLIKRLQGEREKTSTVG